LNILKEDTIAAISTPYGTGGVGKIRVSGPEAEIIVDKIFKMKKHKYLKDVDSHTVHYGYIIDKKISRLIDEVIVTVVRRPRSFTGENVVEIDCHGGIKPLENVLELLIKNGARMAEPGEFSKRAFLNGRIDLAQAEDIMEVINARTEKGLDLSVDHLTGKLSNIIEGLRDDIIVLLSHLEAAIDFPEDEIEGFNSKELGERINNIKEKIKTLLETSRQGKIYQEGIKTVIVGKPNVGKSSLLNFFLEEKRAIVTEVPGTTRDIIAEYINLKGIPLKIIDTAGIRETENLVEKIGVEKTRDSLNNADLVLMMLDVNQGITDEDLKVYDLIKEKPLIVIINKTDLPNKIDREKIDEYFLEHPIIWISIKEEEGLNELKDAIINEVFIKEINPDNEVFISRARHINALKRALESLDRVIEAYNNGMAYDFLTIDIKDSLNYIGEITGETVTEDIIDRIFSDFCLGK